MLLWHWWPEVTFVIAAGLLCFYVHAVVRYSRKRNANFENAIANNVKATWKVVGQVQCLKRMMIKVGATLNDIPGGRHLGGSA